MQIVKFLRRKCDRFCCRRYRLIFFPLLVLLTCFSIGIFKQASLQAQYVPAALRTNPWQYASFPVENFQGYTSPFGYRTSPVNGSSQFHYGLDIAAPLGSYVRNWWAGQVVELSDNTACGTSIKIQSGEWKHIYCHLMGKVESTPQGRYLLDQQGGIILWLGQQVPVGARIGRVGMTGRTTGPHLHWGLVHGNQYVDPAIVLRLMLRGAETS